MRAPVFQFVATLAVAAFSIDAGRLLREIGQRRCKARRRRWASHAEACQMAPPSPASYVGKL
jgi:hypothetical protein